MKKICALVAVLVLSLSLGCEKPRTETLVFVDAEQGVRRYIEELRIQVRREAGEGELVADYIVEVGSSSAMPANYPVFVGLVPEGNVGQRLRIDAIGFVRDQPIIKGSLITGYVEEETRSVTITLDDSCIGVICESDDEVCQDGICEEVRFDNGARIEIDGDEVVPELASTCHDGEQNDDETGVDCGGTCPGCVEDAECDDDSDCASQVCDDGECAAATCADEVRNNGETNIDCGGDCDPCVDRDAFCVNDSDCASRRCVASTCESARCDDGIKNGEETDVDCGGQDCSRCATSLRCLEGSDCVSGFCTPALEGDEFGVCRPGSCMNGAQDGAETGVDCGGGCPGCSAGTTCVSNEDCASGVCDSGACASASCDDEIANGDETDVDCGGETCGTPCEASQRCVVDSDCETSACVSSVCLSGQCSDGRQNGDETDEDCGGTCGGCDDGQSCNVADDCQSRICSGGSCRAPACDDGVENGDETDVDCGGECEGCADTQACLVPDDCGSGVCVLRACVSGECGDGAQNGTETDTDCGGNTCAACSDGEQCELGSDCESGVCRGGECQGATCGDSLRNGDETDVDCGGPICGKCGSAKMCLGDRDCISDVCAAGQCDSPGCTDGARNGDETDDDCGGSVCEACAVGERCELASDCRSGICSAGFCGSASCSDSMTNGSETDTDCGGGRCDACNVGQNCGVNSDCNSGVCTGGMCSTATCTDSVRNGNETDVDCGGTCPLDCPDGRSCAGNGDCASGVCSASNICSSGSCGDGTKNGAETDVDCGGPSCGGCEVSEDCAVFTDCLSGVCNGGSCGAGNCMDGTRNGTETDVDCGGGCPNDCTLGQACGANGDCATGVCDGGACAAPSCSDGVRNGAETDVDCGGGCPNDCANGQACVGGGDCDSGSCMSNQCVGGGCGDGVQNNMETDVDCGGPDCAVCADARTCGSGGDCASGVCGGGLCRTADCSDGVRNGAESDMDCGGGSCDPCLLTQSCGGPSDCGSRSCVSNSCAAPTCSDGVKNGLESAIDCGGPGCAPCPPTAACGAGGDCTSGVCVMNACASPSCGDAVQNGLETDLNCGGNCPKCAVGDSCVGGPDCVTGVCSGSGTCVAETCTDSIQNGDESGIDCGGSCNGCPAGASCMMNSDCASQVCQGGFCSAPSCSDGALNNQGTTNTCSGGTCAECGGPICESCPVGATCLVPSDCSSGICNAGSCVAGSASCTDGMQNGSESDVDCGGATCPRCELGDTCGLDGDCNAGNGLVCLGGQCKEPAGLSCNDAMQNSDESDVDCGGTASGCAPCVVGRACNADPDCASRACGPSGVCVTSCEDFLKNGDESGVDCGGPLTGAACPRCTNDRECDVDTDCASLNCEVLASGAKQCKPPVDEDPCDALSAGAPCGPGNVVMFSCANTFEGGCGEELANITERVPTCTTGASPMCTGSTDIMDVRLPSTVPMATCQMSAPLSTPCGGAPVQGPTFFTTHTCRDAEREEFAGQCDGSGSCSTSAVGVPVPEVGESCIVGVCAPGAGPDYCDGTATPIEVLRNHSSLSNVTWTAGLDIQPHAGGVLGVFRATVNAFIGSTPRHRDFTLRYDGDNWVPINSDLTPPTAFGTRYLGSDAWINPATGAVQVAEVQSLSDPSTHRVQLRNLIPGTFPGGASHMPPTSPTPLLPHALVGTFVPGVGDARVATAGSDGSADGEVRVYDQQLMPVAILDAPGGTGAGFGVAMDADGQWLVVADADDNSLRLYDFGAVSPSNRLPVATQPLVLDLASQSIGIDVNGGFVVVSVGDFSGGMAEVFKIQSSGFASLGMLTCPPTPGPITCTGFGSDVSVLEGPDGRVRVFVGVSGSSSGSIAIYETGPSAASIGNADFVGVVQSFIFPPIGAWVAADGPKTEDRSHWLVVTTPPTTAMQLDMGPLNYETFDF